jgi:hypothetical protein
MPIRRTGDPGVDRAFNDSEASRLRDEKSYLSKGVLGTPITYGMGAVVLRPGQAALMWAGRSAATVTLPPAAGLRSGSASTTATGSAQWVVIHNEGTGVLTVKPNAKETIADGFLASSSVLLRPGQTLLLVSDGKARWATAPASSLAWAVDSFAASTALVRSNQVVTWTGGAGTLTLPAANVEGAGNSHFVYVFNNGSGTLTVAAAGADTIADGLADSASVTMVPHSGALLWSDGTSKWAADLPAAPIGSAEHDYERGQSASSGAETWYYANSRNCTALTGVALTIGNIYAMPFIAPKRASAALALLDRIAVRVTTGVAASNIRLGLYANAGSAENPYPGSLLRDSGNLATIAAGIAVDTFSQALTAGGLYWCVVHPSAAISIACLGVGGAGNMLGTDNTLSLTPQAGWFVNQAFGALPASYPVAAGATRITAAPIPAIAHRWST